MSVSGRCVIQTWSLASTKTPVIEPEDPVVGEFLRPGRVDLEGRSRRRVWLVRRACRLTATAAASPSPRATAAPLIVPRRVMRRVAFRRRNRRARQPSEDITHAHAGPAGARVLRGNPLADFRRPRILAGLLANAQVGAVGLGEARGLQPFAHLALVVVDRGQEARGRLLVEEERQRFTASLEAAVELGVGLRERPGGEVSAAEIEPADPGVEQRRRFGQQP